MNRLHFLDQRPIPATSPARTDVACFVGLVSARESRLPADLREWLVRYGWGSEQSTSPDAPLERKLLNVPVPIDSWDQFDRLFAWDARSLGAGVVSGTYLGAAVRSYFAEGGRRCYVVRAGDPLPSAAQTEDKDEARSRLVPAMTRFDAADRSTWRGVTHLTGLPDVSFLCLPDLPELFAIDRRAVSTEESVLGTRTRPPEQFVECSEPVAPPPVDSGLGTLSAPRSNAQALEQWRDLIGELARFLSRRHRQVQLVASIPLALENEPAASDLGAYMASRGWLPGSLDPDDETLESRFVQLSFPWLRTPQARLLPGHVEPPEGALAGVLARNALTRGTFRSATKLRPITVHALQPELPVSAKYGARHAFGALAERVSLWDTTPGGVELASDVTTSGSTALRPASIGRTIALVVRSARLLGEEMIFESSGEQLWRTIERRLTGLLQTLFNIGALDGKSARDAYSVRCDRSTMTQHDIDNGRLVAEITMRPTASIEQIRVGLVLQDGGQVSLGTLPRRDLAVTGP